MTGGAGQDAATIPAPADAAERGPAAAPAARSGFAETPAGGGRVWILDPLRGAAAFAVMWFHLTGGGVPLWKGGTAGEAWVRASGSWGWLGVDVFFVVSGFVLPYSMRRGGYTLRDGPRFLWKRLLRLEPPYLVAVALSAGLLAVGQYMPGYAGEPFAADPKRLLLHFGYLNAVAGEEWYNPVFWTLAVEFQFYLLIAVLYPLTESPNRLVRAAAPAGLAGLAFLPVPNRYVLPYLALFALGTAASQYVTGLISRRVYYGLFAGTSAAAWFTLGVWPAALGALTAAAVVGSRALPAGGRAARLSAAGPLAWLGAVSYSLYLVHVPVGARVLNLGGRFADGLPGKLAALAAAAAASLLAAWAMHALVERPSRRWSSAVRYVPREGAPRDAGR